MLKGLVAKFKTAFNRQTPTATQEKFIVAAKSKLATEEKETIVEKRNRYGGWLGAMLRKINELPYRRPFGTFSALKPIKGRTDFSRSAEVHRERLNGERMTRSEHRRLVRRRELHAQRRAIA